MEFVKSRVTQLIGVVSTCDAAIAAATHKRLLAIAELDSLLGTNNSDSTSRETVTAVAAASKCSSRIAAADVQLARSYAEQDRVQTTLVNGEVTVGQLASVSTLASGTNSEHAVDVAKNLSHWKLERLAAEQRSDHAERSRRAHTNRTLRFRESEDQTELTLIATGPWEQVDQLRKKYEQAAHRLGRGIARNERERFDARMYDAFIANATNNIAVAKPRTSESENSIDEGSFATGHALASAGSAGTADSSEHDRNRGGGVATANRLNRNQVQNNDFDEPFPGLDDETIDDFLAEMFDDVPDSNSKLAGKTGPPQPERPVIVKSDAKVIVHIDYTDGSATYLDGPRISHARLDALLCHSAIDIVAMKNGKPAGIATNHRTSNAMQTRYIIHRDGPCRNPGCHGIGPTEIHHTKQFAKNPEAGTSTEDCIALCWHCHHQHHEGLLTITGDAEGTVVFTYADGRVTKSTVRGKT